MIQNTQLENIQYHSTYYPIVLNKLVYKQFSVQIPVTVYTLGCACRGLTIDMHTLSVDECRDVDMEHCIRVSPGIKSSIYSIPPSILALQHICSMWSAQDIFDVTKTSK